MRVHDSQAYRKMDVTMARISRILELREILLSFQTGFNLHDAGNDAVYRRGCGRRWKDPGARVNTAPRTGRGQSFL